MTNLERARKGERLKVEAGKESIKGIVGEYFLPTLPEKIISGLAAWINMQIREAVTHAIDDTPDPVLWRDLGPDDIIQEGDRYYSNLLDEWVYVSLDGRVGTKVTNSIVQRPAKLETNS